MGRKRRAVEDRKLTGEYRADRHGPAPEEGGEAESLVRPSSLSTCAVLVWDELVGMLAGVARKRDVPVLAELCRWVERSNRIAAALDAMQPTDKDFGRLLVSAGIATDKVDKLASRFGLNPTDRAKVPQGEGPAKAKVPTRPRTKLDTQGGP